MTRVSGRREDDATADGDVEDDWERTGTDAVGLDMMNDTGGDDEKGNNRDVKQVEDRSRERTVTAAREFELVPNTQ